MARVSKPRWILTYRGVPVGSDGVSLTYTDFDHGKADEIEVEIEDRDHLWKSAWYPVHGDMMALMVGYQAGPMMPAGMFEVDEVEAIAPPDTVRIRGLAPPVTESLRTKNTRAFENQTLEDIVLFIAGEHGLSHQGEIAAVDFERITQNDERDLEFLKRLADEYGHVATVRGTTLVFMTIESLEARPPVAVLIRTEMKGFAMRDRTREIYKACEVRYHDAKTKELLTHTEEAEGILTGDTLKIKTRCENQSQAERKAKVALHKANSEKLTGRVTMIGMPTLVAGNPIMVLGCGRVDGKYMIRTSRHRLTRRGGYETEVDIRCVP